MSAFFRYQAQGALGSAHSRNDSSTHSSKARHAAGPSRRPCTWRLDFLFMFVAVDPHDSFSSVWSHSRCWSDIVLDLNKAAISQNRCTAIAFAKKERPDFIQEISVVIMTAKLVVGILAPFLQTPPRVQLILTKAHRVYNVGLFKLRFYVSFVSFRFRVNSSFVSA